jgi:hypothetical protein
MHKNCVEKTKLYMENDIKIISTESVSIYMDLTELSQYRIQYRTYISSKINLQVPK